MRDESTNGPGLAALPVRTLRLDLEYDGTDFSGWQFQPGLRTIQGTLEAALRRILDEPAAAVVGAGRTDSGTHAAGQVAHVCTASALPAAVIQSGLNSVLPRDLRARRIRDAAPDFHARYAALAKEYRYHFWHGSPVPPCLRNSVLEVRARLDVAAMAEAARWFEGTMDFSSFRAASCTAATPVRTIQESRVGEHGAQVVYAVRSRGFLQHMVRILSGTLLKVGRGALRVDQVPAILAARDRAAAPATLSAHGLWLVRVEYAGEGGEREALPEPVVTYLNS